jgi:hypothetical protein
MPLVPPHNSLVDKEMPVKNELFLTGISLPKTLIKKSAFPFDFH